ECRQVRSAAGRARSHGGGRAVRQQVVQRVGHLCAEARIPGEVATEDFADLEEALHEGSGIARRFRGDAGETRRERVVDRVFPALLVAAEAIADPGGDDEAQALDRAVALELRANGAE